MNLNELYTQIITENSRSKENRHPVEGATHSLEGVNPSCGDDITLQLRVKDGVIEDAGFIGTGCAISQASASLMIDLVKGRTVEDARRLTGLSEYSYGNLTGTVTSIDSDVTSSTSGSYYKMTIKPNSTYVVSNGGDKVDLANGMSVTARVEYDELTYFDYVMEALGVLFR